MVDEGKAKLKRKYTAKDNEGNEYLYSIEIETSPVLLTLKNNPRKQDLMSNCFKFC